MTDKCEFTAGRGDKEECPYCPPCPHCAAGVPRVKHGADDFWHEIRDVNGVLCGKEPCTGPTRQQGERRKPWTWGMSTIGHSRAYWNPAGDPAWKACRRESPDLPDRRREGE